MEISKSNNFSATYGFNKKLQQGLDNHKLITNKIFVCFLYYFQESPP